MTQEKGKSAPQEAPHVSLTIAGRTYRMACDEGQQGHLLELGGMLDARIDSLRASFGEIGDMRLAVMAAITIADELTEARQRIAGLEAETQRVKAQRASTEQAAGAALSEAAARIERLVLALDKGAA